MTFITRKQVSRRALLKGLGYSLALPLLDSMVPALRAAASSPTVKRMGIFYVPNGMSMPYWWPKSGEGALSELPPTLVSLNPLKDRALLVGGLADRAADLARGGGEHAHAASTFLTCVPSRNTTGADAYAAVSMDQLAARKFSGETQLGSIELGIESNALIGSCDGGGCAFTNTIAWSTPTTALPVENDPRAVFERLFGDSGSTNPTVRMERMARDRSILDLAKGDLGKLVNAVGPADKHKLDEFSESVRDIERRIQMAEKQNTRELPVFDQPVGIPSDFAQHAKLMMDLLAITYQIDMTRVSTFMLAKEISTRAYPEIGVSDGHHPVSHHQDEAVKLERLYKVNEYHFQQFAYLCKKLAATREGDGTMLDHTLMMYGTGISDSNTHFHDDLPIVLVGGEKTGVKGGRYVRHPKGTPLANLHVAMLQRMGVEVESFGDSTGPLGNLD